ncbi:MAG: GntR family transcriptional regulator [Candidatus Pelethousia sp.]|nr:GntR family transcriptional regulator [Candidatus Pelethousia sp.]
MNKEDKLLPLSMQITRRVLAEIQTGIYRNIDRLPPEIEIASLLGVSRTVVRDALSTLEREGFISRKHGKGTSINRHVLEVKTRIDLEKEFISMVKEAGFAPTVKVWSLQQIRADAVLAGWLDLEEGAEVISVDRVVYADGIPTIYCIDTIDQRLVQNKDYCFEDLQKPIFDFLRNYCGVEVYMDLTEMHAVNADDNLAKILDVPTGTALLHLNERGYSYEGRLVLYSSEYYREGILKHTILRKKI